MVHVLNSIFQKTAIFT